MAQIQAKVNTQILREPAAPGSVPNDLDQDYVFKSAMETVTLLEELIVKVSNRVHKFIRGTQWLSTDANDLCDRLVKAEKPVIRLINWIRRNGPPVRKEDNSMYLEIHRCWKVVDPLISEAHKFLGH